MAAPKGNKLKFAVLSFMETAKLNKVDPQAWITDIFTRIESHKTNRIDELLHYSYKV